MPKLECILEHFKESNFIHFLCLLVILSVEGLILYYLLYIYGKINFDKIRSVIITFSSLSLGTLILIVVCILLDWVWDRHRIIGDILIPIFMFLFLGFFFLISKGLYDDIKLLHTMNLTPISLIFTIVSFTLTSVFFGGESWTNVMRKYKLSNTGKFAEFSVQLYLIILSTTFTIWRYINNVSDDYTMMFFVTFSLTAFFMIIFMLFFYILFHWSKYNNIVNSIFSKIWDYDPENSYQEINKNESIEDKLFSICIQNLRKH